MPLFRQGARSRPAPRTGLQPRPVAVGDEDLRRADRVLATFEEAVGTRDTAVRAAALEIARAGGSGSMADLLRDPAFLRRPDTDEWHRRPWHWLSGVASEAAERGEPMLVARVCLFTEFWERDHRAKPDRR